MNLPWVVYNQMFGELIPRTVDLRDDQAATGHVGPLANWAATGPRAMGVMRSDWQVKPGT